MFFMVLMYPMVKRDPDDPFQKEKVSVHMTFVSVHYDLCLCALCPLPN